MRKRLIISSDSYFSLSSLLSSFFGSLLNINKPVVTDDLDIDFVAQ
jgi:hypothetical protein